MLICDSQSYSPAIHFLSWPPVLFYGSICWWTNIGTRRGGWRGLCFPLSPPTCQSKTQTITTARIFHQLTRMTSNMEGVMYPSDIFLICFYGPASTAGSQKILWTTHCSGYYHNNMLGAISGQDSMDKAGCIQQHLLFQSEKEGDQD